MPPENKKIGIIASSAHSFIGFRLDLIKDFLAAGFHVHCIAPEMTPEVSSVLQKLGCECHEYALDRAGMNIFKDCVSGLALFRILREVRPDIVLAYTIKPVIYGMLAARFAGIEKRCALISGLGYAFTHSPVFSLKKSILRKLTSFLYRISLLKAYTVIFQNIDDQNLFEELGIVSCAQSRRVDGSGVNLEVFPYTPLTAPKK
ncbi:MAG: glycosyltransferase family 4 protein, partial [bacterium]|nr:glycosyltransferase family 4 protein [bacterium]